MYLDSLFFDGKWPSTISEMFIGDYLIVPLRSELLLLKLHLWKMDIGIYAYMKHCGNVIR